MWTSAVDVVNPVAQRTRRVLLIACLLTVPAVAWRGADVAAAVARDRDAASAYQRGVVLENDGRYDEAAAAFRQAIATSPSAITAYADLGDVELSRGCFDEAVQAYRQLMAVYPYTYFADLRRRVGFIELRAGMVEAAVEDLRQASELDPQDWHTYHLLGHAYFRLGDRRSARLAWERVLALNPGFQPAYERLHELDGQP
ncbi:MAG: hypothetical protein AUI83_01935 [Armatimonadetes bacterium 13_1_40CM_3_65_7]|nr:MAG: hypothetical protein AUI83_01935 [Armatimonadetes bacterium 13_1_40CM_3_65_7]